VGSEYFINSQELEDKVRSLLPSQGGAGAGFDLSASTQIIPIIDLTESAEGSNVRADLQTALSFNDVTAFNVENATSTLVNTTGYFRVFGDLSYKATTGECTFQLTDGASTKILTRVRQDGTSNSSTAFSSYDFIVFLGAGDSLQAVSSASGAIMFGCTKQIADINGNLTTPS
jgi:hypothetical protein